MIGLLQRVSEAAVEVEGETIARIGAGLLVFICVERGDSEAEVERMAERLLGYRVFSDGAGRLNCSVMDADGDLLLVPQFTLAADTHKGMRPSLGRAAAPERGAELFEQLVRQTREQYARVQAGRFGAHMRVALINDGPVTFWLETGRGGAA
ncbi:MAG: D-aminoacyl-tRNA deacylase [Gammaproteobacteria bacterium]